MACSDAWIAFGVWKGMDMEMEKGEVRGVGLMDCGCGCFLLLFLWGEEGEG